MIALDRARAYVSARCGKPYAERGDRTIRTCIMLAGHEGKCEPMVIDQAKATELLIELVRELSPSPPPA